MSPDKYYVFDRMIEGIQIVNKQFKYVYINHSATVHGKFKREELLGCTMMEKYPGIENTGMFAFLNRCMKEGRHHQMVNEFSFPDGSKGFFELRMQPVDEGVLIMSFDVTEQKLAEKLLQNTNAVLDQLVKQRTAELMDKNKELEQFAYIASHDLQEPLRTLSNYIQVFEEDYKEQLDAVALSYLEAMSKAAQRMSLLSRSLLDYSRLGQNPQLTLVNCLGLINEVIADLDGMIVSAEATILIDSMPELYLYETEMRQLFQNLIANAIKFHHKKRKPKIVIAAHEEEDKWRFSVSDNGIGISPVHYDRIFHIFQRLHLDIEYEGSGIGLAYCRKIVRLHGGEIWVESVLDEGSTFYFTISKNFELCIKG